jgi:hypothetical protein
LIGGIKHIIPTPPLQLTLEEEEAADKKLTDLSKKLNVRAHQHASV